LETVSPDLEHRTYRAQSYPRRMVVAVAGSATHFLVAVLLLATPLGAPRRPPPPAGGVAGGGGGGGAGPPPPTTRGWAGSFVGGAGVASLPGGGCGPPGAARLSFALGDHDLEEGLTRVVSLLNG
ncbi:MAG TPA: hypothetical protein QGF43_06545, partial [Acidimicrobiales bacterium]|nr:hypothetical protein [Acidimicrobiales bacterium]